MNDPSKKISNKSIFFTCLLVCILIVSMFAMCLPQAAAKDYIPLSYEYTENYYKTYGEPTLSVSVLGDTEFNRGETARMDVVLANRGVLYGVKSIKSVGDSESQHQLSQAELEYEARRTTAYGVKATLISGTDLIEVDPATNSHTLDKIVPGQLPDNPLAFTLTISNNAPAGTYILELPVVYEYQSDVRMTTGKVVQLGLSTDHATYYTTANITMQIPVIVKPEPEFQVSDVSGELTAGQSGTINVTYTNTGELPAKDAVARIVVMKPLSSEGSLRSLGTLKPGESRTVSFDISAENSAVEKTYGIDSEIRYVDENEEKAFSDNMKVNVDLRTPVRQFNITGLALAGLAVMGLVLIIKNIRKNVRNSGNNKRKNNEEE
ncbi:COG1361 S-layer family protein [Methanolobus halotolerans]|uniref:NPCBM-associated, NEW3 domain of alpha-galactosidase n=1 Tax=Methanolobus halotolerans TaxID=2052935 RepID=A0A4E0Q8P8_9EURY|nr:hypothetical protein [Methanolobus halotolerans]TGC08326.1 hypothetical protein CUN85_09625 [Methanolobus halotolerans]